MQHAGDLVRTGVQIGQEQIGLLGPAVHCRGTTVMREADRLIAPIGELIAANVTERFQHGEQGEGLFADRPRGHAAQDGLDGKEPVETAWGVGVEHAVADDAAGNRAGQRPFQRQVLQVRGPIGPFP